MQIIRGDNLTDPQQREALSRFVHRWTHENAKQTYGGKCPGCEQGGTFPRHAAPRGQVGKVWTRAEWHAFHTPLTTDAEWLKAHAFHVNKDGRLSNRHNHCEPAYMAELEGAK